MKTVIIGGVAGGASAAARLRRLDEQAEIVVLERGDFVSFANCGLPYFIGGEITEQSALTLQTPQSFKARFHVDVRVRSEAVAIDPAAKEVRVRDLAWLPRPDADDPCPAPVLVAVAHRSAEAYAFTVAEELAPGDFLRIRTP